MLHITVYNTLYEQTKASSIYTLVTATNGLINKCRSSDRIKRKRKRSDSVL